MGWRTNVNEYGVVTGYRDTDTGERVSIKEYERRMQMQGTAGAGSYGTLQSTPGYPQQYLDPHTGRALVLPSQPMQPMQGYPAPSGQLPQYGMQQPMQGQYAQPLPYGQQPVAAPGVYSQMPQGAPNGAGLIQPNATMIGANQGQMPQGQMLQGQMPQGQMQGQEPMDHGTPQGKSLRMHTVGKPTPQHIGSAKHNKGFLDATSIAILMPTLVLLALIIAAAHKKRLFPWQTIRTFNPPSGLMTPRDYERSFVCPPNGRRHGRMGKKNPNASWTEADGVVIPFGFLARTHLPVTIPMGRLPNKNMFIVAPSGSGKTTLMRAVIKALLAKPCVIIALEAKANDPNLDEKREGFKYTVLPEAQHAGFRTLYFNPLDAESIHWNPLDLDANTFASSIVQDINSLPPEEQHWAERDMGYIEGLVQLLKWGAVQVAGEDENGQPAQLDPLPCNPWGLMKLVNNRRNIVESMRKMKSDPNINAAELSELTQRLSSIIRTDSDWDKNIQGVRGRLRMFKNAGILRCTMQSNVNMTACMHEPTVLIFGTPASLGPDAESLASCFVYQLQQALHTRYGTKSVLPLFAFFDEYQTLNIDLAGRLSAIVRGANGGLTVILQNVSQIEGAGQQGVSSELKTIFSNSAVRVCLHNADETTAKFFSDEIGRHAIVVPGIADHFQANGFGIFPTSWNRIHSQQVVSRVDSDSIKRMEKHHALVYLSPAGDPEFGETKPFMCDLRGIEEIAKLHLLHNVTTRKPSSPPGMALDEEDGPVHTGGVPSMPGFASQNPGALVDVLADVAAQSHEPDAYAPAPAPMPVPGVLPAAPGVVAYNNENLPQSQPQTAAAAEPFQSQPAQANTGANRICPSCNKPAGKGKFCIECGQFIGAVQAAPVAAPQAELATSARVVSPAQAVQAPFVQPAADNAGFGAPMPVVETAPQNNLSATAQPHATPRYGGLAPQSREALPSKRGLFEGASQIAETAQQVLSGPAEAPRRPITSLNAAENQGNPQGSNPAREPKRKPGVEF